MKSNAQGATHADRVLNHETWSTSDHVNHQAARAVHRALGAATYSPLRTLQVSVIGDEVVLRGEVPSYYMLQMAQSMAMNAAGNRKLRNELQVARED